MNNINFKKSALLIIDAQNDYCSMKGKIALSRGEDVESIQKTIKKLNSFIKKFRQLSLPIIFLRMNKDRNFVNKNLRNKLELSNPPLSDSLCVPGTFGFEYFKLKPKRDDFEIVKYSYDAFSSDELKSLLKSLKVNTVLITGFYSQVCVDATIKGAFSFGYDVVVIKDLIATTKSGLKLEKALLNQWELFFAIVIDSDEFFDLIMPNFKNNKQ